ncbi:Diacylglycerol kinase 4 [Forsythia ovata]|uniref:Diacylglycerol kinase 4 n=1 Tax=Forsythia ovata TaxID=205694 RepID=A0ABD1P039_9LAMI
MERKNSRKKRPGVGNSMSERNSYLQVFDLSSVKPHEFVQYGLACLEKFASLGDSCAKETREKLRVVVAGGDGTVGWVLGCLGELNRADCQFHRQGGFFPFNWKSAIKRTLDRIGNDPTRCLDSWHVLVTMPAGVDMETPYSLKATEETPLDQVCGRSLLYYPVIFSPFCKIQFELGEQ